MRSFCNSCLLLIASVILITDSSSAQTSIEWQKTLGGYDWDLATSMQQTEDGGYIIAGRSASTDGDVTGNHGTFDFWIVKLDSLRVIQWEKSFGGSNVDNAFSIKQTNDNGYIIAGTSLSVNGDVTSNHGGDGDFWIVKIDSSGTLQWQKTYGGSGADAAQSIEQTTDGGYIICGNSYSSDGDLLVNNGYSDFWIIKINSTGALEWQRTIGGDEQEFAASVKQTSDGGYIVGGTARSASIPGIHGFLTYDCLIVKLNSTGSISWQKAYGGTGDDKVGAVKQTTDGGYIIGAYSASNNGDVSGHHGTSSYDAWVFKVDAAGTLQWQQSYGGTLWDEIGDIIQSDDGGYVFAASTASNDGDVINQHGDFDYWIVKLTSQGIIQWKQTLGGNAYDVPLSIYKTTEGNYIVAGWTTSTNGDVTGIHGYPYPSPDYWIVKVLNSCTLPNIPSPITILGSVKKVCPGDTVTLVTNPDKNVTFHWDVPISVQILNGQGTRSIKIALGSNYVSSSQISVSKVNACGSSSPRSIQLPFNLSTPSPISGPNFGLCGAHNVVFSVQAVQGMTYNWTVPGVANIVSGQGTNSIVVNFKPMNFKKTISVTATNACGTSTARTLVVRAAPQKPGTINGATSVCANSSVPYSITPVTYATSYTWTAPAAATITANGITSLNNIINTSATSVTVNFGTIPTNASIKVHADNKCGNSANSSISIAACTTGFSCNVTINSDNTECNPDCNGSATVNVVGGTSPYDYNWMNSNSETINTTQTATELCRDNYTVIVTDNNGNTSICNVTIGGGSSFTLPDLQDVDIMFSGWCSPFCNGYINVIPSIGSPQDYTYLWSNGATTNQITGLCGYNEGDSGGDYTVTVTDNGGCTQSAFYFMENHISFLAIACQTTNDESSSGAADGEIEVSIAHGGGPFTYQWSNGQTGSTASGLTAGIYTVTVTDATACTATATCEVVTISPRTGKSTTLKLIDVKPNPFVDKLNIEITTDEPLIVSIKDVTGKVINSYADISNSLVINDNLDNGIYFIFIQNKSGDYYKVVKVLRNE